MVPKALVPFLVTMMLVTGVCNTLLTKYQDMQCVRNCDSPNPSERVAFEQPVLQTLQMFVGEMGCWLVLFCIDIWKGFIAPRFSSAPLFTDGYQSIDNDADDEADAEADDIHKPDEDTRTQLSGNKILLLALPACCDITGTTLMNVGLLFVVASIYQMTRGALVLFVGLFSVIFLKRKLYFYQWFSLVCVVLGVALVGLAGAIFPDHHKAPVNVSPGDADAVGVLVRRVVEIITSEDKHVDPLRVVLGVFLIAFAQIFTASQFVLEEWILEKYAMNPLKVVGWEGIFGFLVTALAMVVLHFTIGITESGRFGYFDAVEGWRSMTGNKTVALTSLLIMISIGGFNFFGLSVTRSLSATSRSTIDTSRTLFIWLVSLGLGWETFKWLQVLGFAMLVYGTFLFNDIITPPLKACLPSDEETRQPLLPEEPIEHI
ncbi:integral membrane protein [Nannizzia gypsea CBS 118893]|uniref:Integral membrane protein n=1 Tax=Arthroderma gypseum (strain ATCC MYA-4604 / CBS 118893) TaxID=535722 RepID=E5QYW7_ARTGP|nr:integral membrane protein [Nannizzia gypsea CBS 118893]EFQ98090.1 integral membrane protein [Nannizzia gypsea CBS 118893]